jgi:hypothetical protein
VLLALRFDTIGIIDGVPWASNERRVLSEEGGTSTVDERSSRIKSAGRQVSRTSSIEAEAGVIYWSDCLNRSTLK